MGADADISVSPVTMDVNINGLDNVDADIDLGLDDIKLHLDKVEADMKADLTAGLAIDEIKADMKGRLTLDEIKADLNTRLTLDELKAQLKAMLATELKADMRADLQASVKELAPIIFRFFWDGIPLVKIGFPHRYKLGFQVCGRELFALTFCGESELVSEKNPCNPNGSSQGGGHG